MSRLSVILLFLSLSVPFTGAYTWLHWQLKATRKEVKKNIIAGLDRTELVTLKFSKEEVKTALRWEHSREFEFQGQMYDIVEILVQKDSLLYLCWWDHAETRLNRQLSDLTERAMHHDHKSRERQSRLQHFLKCLFPPGGLSFFPLAPQRDQAVFASESSPPSSPVFSPLVPPPEKGASPSAAPMECKSVLAFP